MYATDLQFLEDDAGTCSFHPFHFGLSNRHIIMSTTPLHLEDMVFLPTAEETFGSIRLFPIMGFKRYAEYKCTKDRDFGVCWQSLLSSDNICHTGILNR